MAPLRSIGRISSRGYSLIEVMIVVAIMGIVAVGAMQFFAQQVKSNNYLEFQAKREQLRLVLLSQFLNDPNNCKCLFNGTGSGLTFATNGATTLTQTLPTSVQSYNFAGASTSCASAIPQIPFIDQIGSSGLKLTTVSVDTITPVSGFYQGSFNATFESVKDVLGPRSMQLKIPVNVFGTTSGGHQLFQGCGLKAASHTTTIIPVTINDINNGGGSPCHNGCGHDAGEITAWTVSCAKRLCVQRGYVGGVVQEYDCSAGIWGSAQVACWN